MHLGRVGWKRVQHTRDAFDQTSWAVTPGDWTSQQNSFGTALVNPDKIEKAIREVFRLTPKGIIESLKLRAPIYSETAAHGHFRRRPLTKTVEVAAAGSHNGKTEKKSFDLFTWEKTDKAEALRGLCS